MQIMSKLKQKIKLQKMFKKKKKENCLFICISCKINHLNLLYKTIQTKLKKKKRVKLKEKDKKITILDEKNQKRLQL